MKVIVVGCGRVGSAVALELKGSGWDVSVIDSTRVVLTPTPSGTTQALKDAMGVARDVVRRRIDPSGTKEITVITEGGNRILVEVPGVEDPEALKKLIGQWNVATPQSPLYAQGPVLEESKEVGRLGQIERRRAFVIR